MGRSIRVAAATFALLALVLSPLPSRAVDLPDPAASTVPPLLFLVGQTNGVADVCEFVVHVAKVGGGNYANGIVTLSFKHTPDLDFAMTQPFPGVTVDCAKREVYATTDAGGNATFRVVGSCIQHPGGTYVPGPCLVHVSVDGICLGETKARAFDLDGQDGVTANDVSIWVTDFGCGNPYTCVEDYNGDDQLGAADLSILVSVLNSHRSQETGDLCLAPPPPPPTPVTGGISLGVSNCGNGLATYSINYCAANSYTDLVGKVTIAGGIAEYTGLEAVVKISETGGGALPAYWRFDNITISSNDCSNGIGFGCNKQRLSAIPSGFDAASDPNCIGASSAYEQGVVADPNVGQWTLWPHPVTASTSDAQVRVLYAISGCDEGSIAANTATVVFGLRIQHGTNPNLCAGCAGAATILFTVEELRLTKKIANKAGCSCTSPQQVGHESHTASGTGVEDLVIILPAAGDSNAVFADGHRPSNTPVEPPVQVSGTTWLAPAIPNPTGSGTVLKFYVPREQTARLAIYDAAGRRLRSLADGSLRAGVHQIAWDGRDESGTPPASGIYFVRLVVAGETFTTSVVVRQ